MLTWLIKREPAWVQARILVAAIFLLTSVVCAIRHSVEAAALSFAFVPLVCVLMPKQSRFTLFEAVLPIPARQLFAARLLATLALVWSPAIGLIAADLLINRSVTVPNLPSVLFMSSFATLVIVALLSLRPKEIAGPPRLPFVALLTGAAGALIYLKPPTLVVVAAACMVTAATLAVVGWMNLAGSYQCAPVGAMSRRFDTPRLVPAFAWRPALRSAFNLRMLGFLPIVFILGDECGWIFANWFAIMAFDDARRRTHWMLSLPVKLWSVLLVSMFVAVLPFAAALVTHHYFFPGPLGKWEMVRAGERPNEIRVAAVLWRRASGSIAPMIQAPWGEFHRPAVHYLLGVPLYSPYETGAASSDRFADWQFKRATEAAYARPIARREFSALSPTDLRPYTDRVSVYLLRCAAFLSLFLVLARFSELGHSHRFMRNRPWLRGIIAASSGLVVLAMAVLSLAWNPLANGGMMLNELPLALFDTVARMLDDNLLAVAAVTIAPVLLLFWVVERQARKSEFVAQTPWFGSPHFPN